MKAPSRIRLAAALLALAAAPSRGAAQPRSFPLADLRGLTLHGAVARPITHEGKAALRVTEDAGAPGEALVLVDGVSLRDGTIEVEVAGKPAPGAAEGARGFIGVAFRVAPGAGTFECFYLRPTNGRADDQLRRNHSTQYISHPEWPWQRLRTEHPGVYESYVDLVPGAWTRVRIEVAGTRARLYVHGAEQPALVVNDLKLGERDGGVALWIGSGTEGYFANLRVTPRR